MNPASDFLHQGFAIMVRSRLRGVWLQGSIPPRPAVWAANHHSWWDPFVADAVVRSAGRETALVMAEEGLSSFGFVRRLGVVGTSEVRAAVDLARTGRVLVVYPERELRPAGPPGPLARGAVWLAEQADAALLAAAVRLTIRGQEAPEAYVTLTEVCPVGGDAVTTDQLADALRSSLARIDDLIASTDPRVPLPGFEQVVRGRRSWDERIAAAGRVGRPRRSGRSARPSESSRPSGSSWPSEPGRESAR